MANIVKIDTNQLDVEIQKSGLEIQECEQIKQSYVPFLNDLANIQQGAQEINFDNPNEEDEKKAHELRMKAVKVRTGAMKLKEDRKRSYLLRGNLEQAAYNLIKASCEVTEDELFNVEKAREIAEKKRKEQLKQERTAILSEYIENPDMFPLGEMSEQAWNDLLSGMKAQKQLKEEQAKKEEADRLAKIEAEKAEQERIRQENERLKKEAEAKEKELAKQKAAAEAKLKKEREAAAEKLRIEQERAAKEKAEAERLAKIEAEKQAKIQAEIEAKAKAEREAREKAERELKAAKEAEEKRIREQKEAEEAERKAKAEEEKRLAKAPEKEKLQTWVNSIKMTSEIPTLKQAECSALAKEINENFSNFKKWANGKINEL